MLILSKLTVFTFANRTESMNRRQLLAVAGTSCTIGLGGCLGFIEDDPTPTAICVQWIWNRTEEPVTAELQILEEDGSVLHGDEFSIEPDEAEMPNGEFTQEPGHYVIRMRLAGQEWSELDTRVYAAEHVATFGRINVSEPDADPYLAIFRSFNPESCEWD